MNPRKCKVDSCFSDGCCRDGRCAKHTLATRHLQSYSAGRKRPTNGKPHLGVELECFGSTEEAYKAMRSQVRVPCTDGSLPSYGGEFKFCLEDAKAIRQIPRFAALLASLGAKVNDRCGFHVHIDAREFYRSRQDEILEWLERLQDWFFCLMPPSRRTSHYCTRLPGTGHYKWANFTSYRTLEVRIHGGTLNPWKIQGWLTAMSNLGAHFRSPDPLPELELFARPSLPGATASTPVLAPTALCLEQLFPSPVARVYLKARMTANGRLVGATVNTPKGPVVESEE